MFLSDARQPVDCKTVGFFLKISKEIGKAWRKSLSPVSLSVFSLIPDLLFDCSRVLEYAKIRTVLQSSQPEVDFLHVFVQFFGQIGSKRVIKLSSTYLVVSMHMRQKKAWFPFEKRRPTTSSLKLSNISPSHPQKWPSHITYTYIKFFKSLQIFKKKKKIVRETLSGIDPGLRTVAHCPYLNTMVDFLSRTFLMNSQLKCTISS